MNLVFTAPSAGVRKFAMAAGLAMLSAAAAHAQSESFGPTFGFGSGPNLVFNLTVPSTVTGDGTLDVTYFGDLNSSNESIAVIVEGTPIATLNGGTQCGTDHTDSVTVPAAVLSAAAADGTVSITFDSTGPVNFFCGDNSPTFVYPGGAVVAVQGTLNFAAASPGPGGGGGSAEAALLANRGALITSNTISTPRRIDRLRGATAFSGGGLSFAGVPLASGLPADVAVSRNGLSFASGFNAGDAMVWTEGRYVAFDDDVFDDGRFAIVHFGADWLVQSNLMVGVAASVDFFSQVDNAAGEDYSGVGWMIGPVATAQVADNLFVDARLAFGLADNEIDRAGGTDSFDSQRALAEVSLIGEITRGAYTVYPEAELAYFREESDAYTSATLGPVDAAEVSIGQARFGALIERPFDMNAGAMAVAFVDLTGLYTHRIEGALTAGSFTQEIEGWSAEAEIGLRFSSRHGAEVNAAIGVGGLFTDADAVTATLGVNIPLQ